MRLPTGSLINKNQQIFIYEKNIYAPFSVLFHAFFFSIHYFGDQPGIWCGRKCGCYLYCGLRGVA